MKAKNNIYISILFILIFSGCNRFEEGPFLDLHSVKKRLKGTWELEILNVGGIDSTAFAKRVGCNPRMQIEVGDGTNKSGSIYPDGSSLDSCSSYYGTWALTKHKDEIYFSIRYMSGNIYQPVGPYLALDNLTWDIKKLTMDQLWLDITYQGQYCWAHFRKL
jgi:hypothetical protein